MIPRPRRRLCPPGTAFGLAVLVGLAGCDDGGSVRLAPAFLPDASPQGPTVYLRASHLEMHTASFEVVGRELPDVYGLAFRLEYEPGALALAAFDASAAFVPPTFSRAVEPEPGLLVVGLSAAGDAAGFARSDEPLATLAFQLVRPTGLHFVASESAVAESDGREASAVDWIGGTLTYVLVPR